MKIRAASRSSHLLLGATVGSAIALAAACKDKETRDAAMSAASRDSIVMVDSAMAYYERAAAALSGESDTAMVVGGIPLRVLEFHRGSSGYTVILTPAAGYEREGEDVTLEMDLAGNVRSAVFHQ